MSGFWLAFIAEDLRRAARNQFRETADSVVLGVIDAILHGNPGEQHRIFTCLAFRGDGTKEPNVTQAVSIFGR